MTTQGHGWAERIGRIIDAYEDGNQTAFAKKIGLSKQAINKLLKTTVPKGGTVQEIIRRYPRVDPEWLTTGRGGMERIGVEAGEGTPLTAQELARLRDQLEGAAANLGKVLAVLNQALGFSSPREDSLQLGEHGEETRDVLDQHRRRKAGGGGGQPKRPEGPPADERYKDDQFPD